jgi:hypothetical protein
MALEDIRWRNNLIQAPVWKGQKRKRYPVYNITDKPLVVFRILLRLFSWIDIGCASSLPAAIRPQLVIVITEVTSNLHLDEFLLTVHTNIQNRLADSFSSIRIFRLARDSLSPLARYQRLREDIHLQSEELQNLHCQNHCLFSAVHLDALFRQAVQTHICNRISKFRFPHDNASRQPYPG